MIENTEQLLDVMESAALRQAAHVERTAHDPVARPLDMRQCIFAALVAAQAEGAVMVPEYATDTMVEDADNLGRDAFARDMFDSMVSASPLRLAGNP